MRVVVSGAAAISLLTSEHVHKLHRLIGFACETRHTIIFNPPNCLEEWLMQIDEPSANAYRKALDMSARAAALLAADTSQVTISAGVESSWGDPVAILEVDDAIRLLEEPLGILVENGENDWQFLMGLMRQSEKERVTDAIVRRWVQVLHGGGQTLSSEMLRRLTYKSSGLRTFVVFDSDRRHPSELENAWAPTGQVSCTGYGFEQIAKVEMPGRYWMLKRRFIESYMPQEELAAAVSGNVPPDAVTAYFRMNEAARWYYNMKKGFAGDDTPENGHRSQALFATLSADEKAALRTGFGRRMAERYAQASQRAFNWDAAAREEAGQMLPKMLRLI